MPDISLLNIALIIGIAGLLFLLIRLGVSVMTVPHSERVCIYRFGRFNRVVGPGLCFYLNGIEDPKIQFDIREIPMEIDLESVFLNGYPLGITVSFRCQFNPIDTIGTDRERLNSVFQLREDQRIHQIGIQLKDSFSNQIRVVTQGAQLADDAQLFERLKPILPGTDERDRLLALLRPELEVLLANEGYRLSQDKPVTISRFSLPDKLGPMLGRKRQVDEMRKQSPDLTDREIAVILAAMDGKPISNIHEYGVTGGGDARIERRFRDAEGGEERISIRANAPSQQPAKESLPEAKPEAQPEKTMPQPAPAQRKPDIPADDDLILSRADIEVLKTIPSL